MALLLNLTQEELEQQFDQETIIKLLDYVTPEDIENIASDNTELVELQAKYDELKQKYISRFFNPTDEPPTEEPPIEEPPVEDEPIDNTTIDDLFKEREDDK